MNTKQEYEEEGYLEEETPSYDYYVVQRGEQAIHRTISEEVMNIIPPLFGRGTTNPFCLNGVTMRNVTSGYTIGRAINVFITIPSLLFHALLYPPSPVPPLLR